MGLNIIIAEDEDITRKHLIRSLTKEGYEATGARNGLEALAAMEKEHFDVLITDIRMPEMSGLELLEEAKLKYPGLEVLVVTGYGSIDSAVDAMKKGAYEYITKPFNLDELIIKIRNIHERKNLKKENTALRAFFELNKGISLVARSGAMQKILDTVASMRDSDCSVFITGESGVGKSAVARMIHFTSRRQNMPFLAANCPGLSENSLAEELFGTERDSTSSPARPGKGLVEIADSGTLFLNGISELSPGIQAGLFRVMEEGIFLRVNGTNPIPVNVRIISSSERNLEGLVADGKFLKDLFYRMNVIELYIPPLREHKEDIGPLCSFFLQNYSARSSRKIQGFSDEAMEILGSYSFPGNVRELENIVERAVILEEGPLITPESLPRSIKMFQIETFSPQGVKTIDELTKDYACKVLALVEGDRQKAAKLLGVSEIGLWKITKE